jgi:thiamine-phosphate pyrophosphorylase
MLIVDPAVDIDIGALGPILEAAPRGRIAIQLRTTEGGASALHTSAETLRSRTRAREIPLLINDRVDVALLTDADGVHLKEHGLNVEEARALLGPSRIIGASCHDASSLRRRSSADYVVLGPFGNVPGKNPPLELFHFAALTRNAPMPIFALGGIDETNTGAAIRAGATGVACIRSILRAPEPTSALLTLLSIIDRARATSPII